MIIGGGFGGLLMWRASARGRHQRFPHHRKGRRFRRHLVLEPLSRRGMRHRELHLSAAAGRDRLHAGAQICARAGDLEHSRRIGRHFDLYERALFQTVHPRMALATSRTGRWLVETNRGDRITARFVIMAERSAEPAEAAGHSRHRQLQGPQLPYQPLGLCLHRRRRRGRSDRSGRQARRHHRHRRDRRAVRAASRRVRRRSSTSSSARHRRSTCATTRRPIRTGRQA